MLVCIHNHILLIKLLVFKHLYKFLYKKITLLNCRYKHSMQLK